MFTISNTNGNPSTNFGLLTSICNSDGLNTSKEVYGSIPSIYNLVLVNIFMSIVVATTNVIINVENVVDL
jgi:hypothetical protein